MLQQRCMNTSNPANGGWGTWKLKVLTGLALNQCGRRGHSQEKDPPMLQPTRYEEPEICVPRHAWGWGLPMEVQCSTWQPTSVVVVWEAKNAAWLFYSKSRPCKALVSAALQKHKLENRSQQRAALSKEY